MSRYCPRPCTPTHDGRSRWEVWDMTTQRVLETFAGEDAEGAARRSAADRNTISNKEDDDDDRQEVPDMQPGV